MFYIVERPEHAWGDYGDTLAHGISYREDGETDLLRLERTGPFISPITFPGISDIVVTSPFRDLLETSGLKGIQFKRVSKNLIVNSDWHTWDRNADEPLEYPADGEPEGYILGHEHSSEASRLIGDLWEVVLTRTARIYRAREICTKRDIQLITESWQGDDLFRAHDVGYVYATEKAKNWLEEHAADCVGYSVAMEDTSRTLENTPSLRKRT